jgi:DNA-binding Lrp family transcriptional regulator
MNKEFQIKLLSLIERDSHRTDEELAKMLGCDAATVRDALFELESDQIICGYHTLINWDKVDPDSVTALVELRVTPQGGAGYNKIAEVIYQYPEVETLYLMSGAYDFLVILREKNLKAISLFVSEKLAALDEVQSTSTYFTLVKYKEQGFPYVMPKKDRRMVVTP